MNLLAICMVDVETEVLQAIEIVDGDSEPAVIALGLCFLSQRVLLGSGIR